MWMTLKPKAIALLAATAIVSGGAAPAQAMDEQTRNLIKGAAAVLIIGALLSGIDDAKDPPARAYPTPPPVAKPPAAQKAVPQPPVAHAPALRPQPRPPATDFPQARVIGRDPWPAPQDQRQAQRQNPSRDYAAHSDYGRGDYGRGDYARDYPRRDVDPRGYDQPRLDQPPRQMPLR